jgi:hypothetical protein
MDTALTPTQVSTRDIPAPAETGALAPADRRATRQELVAALLLDARCRAADYVARYDAGQGAE